MNHAYIDASWQEGGTEFGGLGGWGLVLICPAKLPERYQGRLSAADNNEAELWAARQAVWLAPAQEALTIHTDNQAVMACLGKGKGPPLLSKASRQLHELCAEKGVALRVTYAARTRRHMQQAHELANVARKSTLSDLPQGPLLTQTDVLLEQKEGRAEACISLRRAGDSQTERLKAWLTLDLTSGVPPSVQILLEALRHARPQETLVIRRSSKLARALWDKPERALMPQVRLMIEERRMWAQQHGIEVELAAK